MNLGFLLAVAAVIGAGYVRFVVGGRVVDPSDTSWFANDPSLYLTGWSFFRVEPWHWPPTYMYRLGWPMGISAGLVDLMPVISLPLRVIQRVLPESFQYFGLTLLLWGTLQMLFGMLIARRWYEDRPRALVLAGAMFLLAPIFVFRLHGHFALSAQWTMLAAILIYLMVNDAGRGRRLVVGGLVLVWCTGGIQPYMLTMMTPLLLAAVVRAALTGVVGWGRGAAIVALGVLTAVASLTFHGYLGNGSLGTFVAAGYGMYSFNLNGFLNPLSATSLLLPPLPTFDGQGEGFSYLGLGMLLLLVWAVPPFVGGTARMPWKRWLPIVVACLLMALYAPSNRVTFGSTVLFEIPLPAWALKIGGAYRASGRFVWPLWYLLLVGALWSVSRLRPRGVAVPLLAIAVALQLADTRGVRQLVRSILYPPDIPVLTSPVWWELGGAHDHLVVLPAWQCSDGFASPGGRPGNLLFARVAWTDGLTLNSFYPSRLTAAQTAYHCDELPRLVLANGLEPRTAYVFTDAFARSLAQQPSGDWRCDRTDGVVLCRASTDPRGFSDELRRDLFLDVGPGGNVPLEAERVGDGWLKDADGAYVGDRWAGTAFRFAGPPGTTFDAVLSFRAEAAGRLETRAAVDGVVRGPVAHEMPAGASELRLPLGELSPGAAIGLGLRASGAKVRMLRVRLVPAA
jgi:hypothetical protein